MIKIQTHNHFRKLFYERTRILHTSGTFSAKLTYYISRNMSIKNVPFGGEERSTDSRITHTGEKSGYWLPARIAEVVIIEKDKTGIRQPFSIVKLLLS